ncbi:MAG TPA: hypothetical protein VLW44_03715 [Streptosporangiaceae bacterium]|nr:hypothetical protein [Streptosporangiaceae bacterium]
MRNVYTSMNMELATARQRQMLTEAAEQRQVRRLRALSRASRRVERARQRLSQAQREALQVGRELEGSWG